MSNVVEPISKNEIQKKIEEVRMSELEWYINHINKLLTNGFKNTSSLHIAGQNFPNDGLVKTSLIQKFRQAGWKCEHQRDGSYIFS